MYEKGILVMNRKQVAVAYVKCWLWFDLIASFPCTWVISLTQGLSYEELETVSSS